MRIPEAKIEEVRLHADILEVVRDYVSLKPKGSNHFGLCPFHNEKTPSFSVNPERGIYKCFGCGKGGDVFSFVMEMEKVGYVEGIRMLAERAGIELPTEETPDRAASNEIESIYHALRFAGRFFYTQMTQTEIGKARALAYFVERGFQPETIKQFGLGYAPNRWDALLNAATEAQVSTDYLLAAGLILQRREGGGFYDRYRDRAIFPLFSHVGKVIGFAGRLLDKADDQPKYINSPETKVYHKGRTLYGLYQGKREIRRKEEAILVEGYTDVISLYQAGIQNVVASSGTALTPDQVKMLARYANRVLLIYDADSAGANAAVRGIDRLLEQGLTVQIAQLPQGADPDSFLQTFGGEAFRNYIEKHRQDFIRFKLDLAEREGGLGTPEGRLEVVRSILGTIALIPNPIVQEGYVQEAGGVLGVRDAELRRELARLLKQGRVRQEQEARRQEIREARPTQVPFAPPDAQPVAEPVTEVVELLPEEQLLIRLMLDHLDPLVEFVLGHMALEEFTEGASRQTVGAFLRQYQNGAVKREPFLNGEFGEDVQQLAAGVLVDREEISVNWSRKLDVHVRKRNEEPFEAAADAMTYLKLDRIDEAIEAHRRAMFGAQQSGADVVPHLKELQALQILRKEIERRSFITRNAS